MMRRKKGQHAVLPSGGSDRAQIAPKPLGKPWPVVPSPPLTGRLVLTANLQLARRRQPVREERSPVAGTHAVN